MTAILEEKAAVHGTLSIPENSGITVLTWDPEDDKQVRRAADAFAAAVKDRMTPVRRHAEGVAADGTMGVVIRDFPAEAADILMRPQMVGG
jgi:hypothetical protein